MVEFALVFLLNMCGIKLIESISGGEVACSLPKVQSEYCVAAIGPLQHSFYCPYISYSIIYVLELSPEYSELLPYNKPQNNRSVLDSTAFLGDINNNVLEFKGNV